jgi:hypothetical protein
MSQQHDLKAAIDTLSDWRALGISLDIAEPVRLLISRVELLYGFRRSALYNQTKYIATFVIDAAEQIPEQYLADARFGHAVREIELFATDCLTLPDTVNVLDRSAEILSRKDIPPGPERFPVGSVVRVDPLDKLKDFQENWTFHHPIQDGQLSFAGAVTRVYRVSYYHGGDVLYELENCGPYYWHEACIAEP